MELLRDMFGNEAVTCCEGKPPPDTTTTDEEQMESSTAMGFDLFPELAVPACVESDKKTYVVVSVDAKDAWIDLESLVS